MTSASGTDLPALFDANAETYDRVNTVISLGLDARWRRWVARKASSAGSPARVLDAFAGTGLVGLAAAAAGARVTLADDSPAMLAVARRRAERRGLGADFVVADLTDPAVEIAGGPFDAITIVFGVRYLEDPVAVVRDLARALRPGGVVVLFDFCVPRPGPIAGPAAFYFFRILPRIASLLAGRRDLYDALVATTRAFGGPDRLPGIAAAAGLDVEEARTMGFGLVVGVAARRRATPERC